MNKITKSFLMLLLLVMGAVSAQAQDAWFDDALYRVRENKGADNTKAQVALAVDPNDDTNQCIVVHAAQADAANGDYTCQFWIRGAAADDATAFNSGDGKGFIVTMDVKADGEYSNIATQAHKDWGYVGNGNFGKLNVTTSWKTVTFLCLSKGNGNFSDLCFNLSGDAARTYYFDNIQITRVPEAEEWFSDNTVVVKAAQPKVEEEDQPDVWYKDGNETTIADLYVADPATGTGCLEVKAIKKKANPWDSQIFISVPEDLVGKQVALTMKVKASKAVSVDSQVHKSNDGNGYDRNLSNIAFGTEWKTVAEQFNTAAYTAQQWDWATSSMKEVDVPDQNTYVLNLTNDDDDVTYYFDEISFEEGDADRWFYETRITDNNTSVSNGWKTVTEGEGEEAKEIGCYEIVSKASASAAWDTQAFIFIPEDARIVSRKVKFTAKVWADADFNATAQAHWSNDGTGYGGELNKQVEFKANTWTDIELTYEYPKNAPNYEPAAGRDGHAIQDGELAYFVLNLADTNGDKPSHTYRIDDVNFQRIDEEDWYANNTFTVDGEDAPYKFGDGEEGGYMEVAGGKELVFGIPAGLQGKNVLITMKVKAAAEDATTDITYTTEWAETSIVVPAAEATYALAMPAEGTFDFDEVSFEPYLLIPDGPVSDEDLPNTAQWYQDLKAQGVKLVTNGEVGYPGLAEARYMKDGDDEFIVVVAPTTSGRWDCQFFIQMGENSEDFPEGTTYSLSMLVKASDEVSVGTQGHCAPQEYWDYNTFGGSNKFTTSWSEFKIENKTVGLSDIEYNNPAYISDEETPEEPKTIKVPQSQRTVVFDLSYAGDGKRYFFFKDIKLVVEKPIVPEEYEWTDVLDGKGNFEGENVKNDYIIGKIMKGHQEKQTIIDPDTGEEETVNVYVFDEEDPEFIRLEKSATSDLLGWKDADGFEFGENVLDITPARQKQNAAGEYAGNDWDSQLFIRLPYVLPQGTKIGLVFDVWSSQTASIPVQEHMEADGNGYLGDFKVAPSVAIAAKQTWQHVAQYGKVDQDMRSIVFNLASVPSGAVYRFDNVQVLVDANELAAIQEYQETLEAPAASWENILELNETIYDAKQVETEDQGYTEASVQALEDAIAAGKALLKENKFTDETLTQAKSDVEAAVAGLEKAPVDCDLTADMYFRWDAVDATAKKTGEQIDPAYVVGSATTMPYGDGSVNEYNFADLSAYDHLVIIATDGEPRLLFNRAAQDDHQGPVSVELPRDKDLKLYEAVVDNGDGSKAYVINLKAIVDKDGYAHLNVIKANGWNGTTTTVTAMKLFVGESEYSDALTAIESVEETASTKDGKYFINGQIVIVKDGKKYNAAGVEIE